MPHLLEAIRKQDDESRIYSDFESLIDYYPSSDLCVLDLVSKSTPKNVNVYGFDWTESSNTNKDITMNLLLEKSFSQKFFGNGKGYVFKESNIKWNIGLKV